jgi:hypothetical protein
LAEIPINNSNSTTSCEDPSQLETNSASIYSSKKLTTFWRNGVSNIKVSGPDISKVNGNSTLKKIPLRWFTILNPNHLSFYFESL